MSRNDVQFTLVEAVLLLMERITIADKYFFDDPEILALFDRLEECRQRVKPITADHENG